MPRENVPTQNEKEHAINEALQYNILSEEVMENDNFAEYYDSLSVSQQINLNNKIAQAKQEEERMRQEAAQTRERMERLKKEPSEQEKAWIAQGMPHESEEFLNAYYDAYVRDRGAAEAMLAKLRHDAAMWKVDNSKVFDEDELSEPEREAVQYYSTNKETIDNRIAAYEAKKAPRVNNAPENSAPVNSAPENKVQEDPAPSVEEIDPEVAALDWIITDDMKKQLDDTIAALDDGNMIFRSSSSEYGVMRNEAKTLRELIGKERTPINMMRIRKQIEVVQEAARAYSIHKVGNETAQTDAKLSSNARKRLDAASKVLDFSKGFRSAIDPANVAEDVVTKKIVENGKDNVEKDFRGIGMLSKATRTDSLMANAVEFYRQQHNLTREVAYLEVRNDPGVMAEAFDMYRDFAQKNKVFERGNEKRYKPDPELKAHVKAQAEFYKNWYTDLANTKVENILRNKLDYQVHMDSIAIVNCSQNEEALRDSYMAEMSEPFGGVEQRIEITDAVAAYQTFVYAADIVINEKKPLEERAFNKFMYDKILKSCEGKDMRSIDTMDVKFVAAMSSNSISTLKSMKLPDYELRAYLKGEASPEIKDKVNSTIEKLYKDFEPIASTLDIGPTSPEKIAEIKDKAMREKCAEQLFEIWAPRNSKSDTQSAYEFFMQGVKNTKAVEKSMENPKLMERGEDLVNSAVYEMLSKRFKKPEPVQEKAITKQVEQQAPDMGMSL